jgi:N-acetylmuramoyl-L-alanine amidase
MKIYITSGHQVINGKGNGAFGVDGFDEAVQARRLVNDIINNMKFANGVDKNLILTDNDSWSLNAVIGWLAKAVTKECLTIDVHFNAFSSPKATGTEVLIADSATKQEISFAKDVVFSIANTLKIGNRGVKKESESARGKLGMLSGGGAKAVNILVEVCFITNPNDVNAYNTRYWNLVENLSKLFSQFVLTTKQ